VKKLERTKYSKVLGIDVRIILNGSAKSGWRLDWDDICFDGDLCQSVVKTAVNHWFAWNVWNCYIN
jgi:predicted phage-related endonuclease